MPRTRPDELTSHPALARVLRWLRHHRRLTQQALRDRVVSAGGSVSIIYIQQIEAGRKRPSPMMLDRLLEALGSGRAELAALCARADPSPPGTNQRRSGYRPTTRDPIPDTLREPAGTQTWSSEVTIAGQPPTKAPPASASASKDAMTQALLNAWGMLNDDDKADVLQHVRSLAARARSGQAT